MRVASFVGALVGVALIAAACSSGGNEEPPRPAGSAEPPSREVTAEQMERAVAVLNAADILDGITGGQTWTVGDGFAVSVPGGPEVVRFDVTWEQPVSGSGPWRELECRSSRITEHEFPWSNITRLRVAADLLRSEILESLPTVWAERATTDRDPIPDIDFQAYEGTVRLIVPATLAIAQVITGDELRNNGLAQYACPSGSSDD